MIGTQSAILKYIKQSENQAYSLKELMAKNRGQVFQPLAPVGKKKHFCITKAFRGVIKLGDTILHLLTGSAHEQMVKLFWQK